MNACDTEGLHIINPLRFDGGAKLGERHLGYPKWLPLLKFVVRRILLDVYGDPNIFISNSRALF